MERVEVDGRVLTWDPDGRGATLDVRADGTTGGRPVRWTFRFDLRPGRVSPGLACPPTSQIVDISIQPGIFGLVLAGGGRADPAGSGGQRVSRWLARLARAASAWSPADPDSLGPVGTVGGAAFPMLGAAYDLGCQPLLQLPRWAAPVLAHATAAEAARAAFGGRTTRPVVAGLVASLVRDRPGGAIAVAAPGDAPGDGSPPDLVPLALALIGAPVLEPDQLARVLGQPTLQRGPDAWPTGQEIHDCRPILADLGSRRAVRLLADAAITPHGPRLLVETLGLWARVRDHRPGPAARRLSELRAQCRDLLPVDPDPSRERWRPPRTAPRPRPAPRPASPALPLLPTPRRTPPAAARPAPVRATPRDPRANSFGPPAAADARRVGGAPARAALTAVDGMVVGGRLRIVLPRTAAEIEAWGARMGNCLASFAPAVTSGRSWLVGVKIDSRLAYCMELTPGGSIRQFLAPRNRRVPEEDGVAVCRALAAAGVVDATEPANRPWLQGSLGDPAT